MTNTSTKYKYIHITGSSDPATERDVSRIEAAIGCKLPHDFREFQLHVNGGNPMPSFFVYSYGDEQVLSWVDQFSPITESLIDPLNMLGESRGLLSMQYLGMPVSGDLISIGICGGNDTLLLSVKGRRKGTILIKHWDDAEPEGDVPSDPEKGVAELAKSFNMFLKMLCSEEEAERLTE